MSPDELTWHCYINTDSKNFASVSKTALALPTTTPRLAAPVHVARGTSGVGADHDWNNFWGRLDALWDHLFVHLLGSCGLVTPLVAALITFSSAAPVRHWNAFLKWLFLTSRTFPKNLPAILSLLERQAGLVRDSGCELFWCLGGYQSWSSVGGLRVLFCLKNRFYVRKICFYVILSTFHREQGRESSRGATVGTVGCEPWYEVEKAWARFFLSMLSSAVSWGRDCFWKGVVEISTSVLLWWTTGRSLISSSLHQCPWGRQASAP